jgi:hypothetical protein
VCRLRPVAVAPVVRFEGVAGEFSQHDFGRIEMSDTSVGRERNRFFASRLKGGRFRHVTPNEREEALFGGSASPSQARRLPMLPGAVSGAARAAFPRFSESVSTSRLSG